MPTGGKALPGASPAPGRTVLNADDIDRSLTRIAHEILESNQGAQNLLLLGIPRRGFPLAARIAAKIRATEPSFDPTQALGQLDITMFRDDLAHAPPRPVQSTSIPGENIDRKTVVLVDDVLYSGRTIRAALDALTSLGRPAAVRLAVLIDRGHRQLPIRADHVGKNIPTSAAERVHVSLHETDQGAEHVSIGGSAVAPATPREGRP